MYCVFCPADDLPALWAYRGLARARLAPLEIFTPEALVYNRRLEHRLRDGEPITHLELSDGRVLDSTAVRGVLNRIHTLPLEHFHWANPDDRAYAAQEQQAVFLSWMYGLPGELINRPGPRGLCGDFRSPAEWAWLAGQAGLPAQPFHQSEVQMPPTLQPAAKIQMIVLDGELFGTQPWRFSEACQAPVSRLAQLAGLRLMGVEFYFDPVGELWFASATPLPDLRLGGEALLDRLVTVLR